MSSTEMIRNHYSSRSIKLHGSVSGRFLNWAARISTRQTLFREIIQIIKSLSHTCFVKLALLWTTLFETKNTSHSHQRTKYLWKNLKWSTLKCSTMFLFLSWNKNTGQEVFIRFYNTDLNPLDWSWVHFLTFLQDFPKAGKKEGILESFFFIIILV